MSVSSTQIRYPRKSLKSGTERESKLDRISDLPDNITDHILSRLPIKDAAKTSVLSNRWRYKWETVPTLVLSDQSFPPSKNDQAIDDTDKLARDIDCLLLHHSGPLLKFELVYRSLILPSREIAKWIHRAARHSLKEFSFWMTAREVIYKVPSCLFSCQSLTHLDLARCSLRLPSTFEGFVNLKSLKLSSVTVADDALQRLVSASPVLEILLLRKLFCLRKLNVYALRSSQSYRCSYVYQLAYIRNFGNLVTLLDDIPQVRELSFIAYYTKNPAMDDVPRELPVHRFYLEILSISINLSRCNETSAQVFLLRSSPFLKKLEIDLREDKIKKVSYVVREDVSEEESDEVEEDEVEDGSDESGEDEIEEGGDEAGEVESEDGSDDLEDETVEESNGVWEAGKWIWAFKCLRYIEIRTFEFDEPKNGMRFIKFMLLTTPVLQKMVFSLAKIPDEKKLQIVKHLCSLERVSSKAKVLCQ